MHRREFSKALVALGVASAVGLPVTVAANTLRDERIRQLLKNVYRDIHPTMPNAEAFARLNLNIAASALSRNPDLYDLDRVMVTPMHTYEGQVVTARTRAFKAEWNMEPAALGTNEMMQQEIITILADEIVTEHRLEQERLAQNGFVMHPYVPVSTRGVVVCPYTFMPKLTFVTRYGVGRA